MKRLVVVLILFTAVFGFSQEEKVVPPQIAIKIGLGDSIELDGAQITFSEVLEDSRCPREVQCVWAGRVRVRITIAAGGDNAISRELIFGQKKQGESTDNIISKTEDYFYEAVGITPYPQVSGEELEYSLLVKKQRRED